MQLEISRNIKHQAIRAHFQAMVIEQEPIGVATIRIQGQGFDQTILGCICRRLVQLHAHACGWATVHGVEYVCGKSHLFS